VGVFPMAEGTGSVATGKVSHVTVNFAVDVGEDLMNSREVAYVKGLTGVNLTQKGTFAEAYSTGTRQFGPGRTKGPTRLEIGEDGEMDQPAGDLDIKGAIFIFATDVIGPGLVGVAFVCSNAGIIPFIIFTCISCVTMIWALDILCACGVMGGIKNYEAVGVLSLGRKGMYITSAAIATECYGALIAYIVMIGNTAPVVATWVNIAIPDQAMMIGVSLTLVLPICCLKNLNLLAFASQYSIVVFGLLLFTNIGNAFWETWYVNEGLHVGILDSQNLFNQSKSQYANVDHTSTGTWIRACEIEDMKFVATSLMDLFGNLPTLVFAVSCVPSALPVFNEMADGKFESMKVVNRVSLYFSVTLYMFVAIAGYYMSRANTLSNNLLNMRRCICFEYAGRDCNSRCVAGQLICKDDALWGGIMNVAFGLAVIAGYATMHYVLRRSIVTVIWGETAEFSWPVHIGIAAANVGCTVLIAAAAGDVSVVFNWAGAVGVPAVGFLLPGIYFNILLGKKNAFPGDTSITRPMAMVLIVAGAAFMIGGVILQLIPPR